MRSMTGFGRGVSEEGGIRVQVEAGSVNRKNLDVQVSLPRGLAPLETVCQKHVSRVCHRGRIQIRVHVEGNSTSEIRLNPDVLQERLNTLNQFAKDADLQPVQSVESLCLLPGIWQEADSMDAGIVSALLEQALEQALQELEAMRQQEGEHLKVVLTGELAQLEVLLRDAEPLQLEAKEQVETRFRAAAKQIGDVGEDVEQRLLQETAVLIEKADVAEELDRLKGHAVHFREKMDAEGPVGRGLDFLCQELAREWHTLSVKTPHSGLNRMALQGKETVERLREQVQNVE